MLSTKQMNDIISVLLFLGTFLSAGLVLIGGFLFLTQQGSDPIHLAALQVNPQHTSYHQIWKLAFSFTSLGIIELGVLLLVITQIFRVALLTGFYLLISDKLFTLISAFILFVLIYCVFWRMG